MTDWFVDIFKHLVLLCSAGGLEERHYRPHPPYQSYQFLPPAGYNQFRPPPCLGMGFVGVPQFRNWKINALQFILLNATISRDDGVPRPNPELRV
jgi:hypothetical protein